MSPAPGRRRGRGRAGREGGAAGGAGGSSARSGCGRAEFRIGVPAACRGRSYPSPPGPLDQPVRRGHLWDVLTVSGKGRRRWRMISARSGRSWSRARSAGRAKAGC
ncbi:hypothetical protein FFK22_011695 [Mycobacterium sp. KBS0706]|nr:hypothetical protein FFK22_011695 [Mycobacterium sp. KBS0706]